LSARAVNAVKLAIGWLMEMGGRARRMAPSIWAAAAGALTLWPDDPRWLALAGFVGLVAWCGALERTVEARARLDERAPTAGLGSALCCGLAFGVAANAVALFSLVSLLSAFAKLSWPLAFAAALLAWVAQAIPFALAAVLHGFLRARAIPAWLSLPLGLVPALALVPQLFPWHVAATQIGFLPWVQVAELGGESLLGVLLLAAAGGSHAAVTGRGRARLLPAAIALGCLALPVGYGLLRLPSIERERARAPTLAIGVVQSNVGIEHKHDGKHVRAITADLSALTRDLEQRGAELTVWGETAYPYPLLRSSTRMPDDDRRVLGEGVRGPILLGLETYQGFDRRAPKFNSAWLLRASGSFGERVDKARLLAFGEYVPLWSVLPPLRARFPSRGFAAGVPGVVTSERGKLGVLICYEDLFAAAARATVQLGARALVNLTNDAWFGDTREPRLHDLLARLRAVELRRDLVRAVNTGVSSFTSASGAPVYQTRSFERTSFVATVRLLDGRTPYARWGDWVTPCCLLGLALCLARGQRHARPAQPATSFFTSS
jgi:apolipoprotein N-acyltransferase